jgi:outer membrane protein assembly factor BamB
MMFTQDRADGARPRPRMPIRTARFGRRAAVGAMTAAVAVVGLAPVSQAAYSNRPTPTWGVNGTVYAMASRGNTTYLGGDFTKLTNPATGASRPAHGLAAIDRRTGRPVPGFSASTNGAVRSLAFAPGSNRLYVGGLFDHMDGAAVRHLGAVTPTGALIRGFKGSATGGVFDLVVNSNSLYVAGKFAQIDGVGRSGLAKLNATTGAITQSWNPELGKGRPVALTLGPNGLVIGGRFASVNGKARRNLAAVTLGSGATTSWSPRGDCPKGCPVFDVDASGTSIFAAIGGPGGALTAYNATTGAVRWSDHADGDMQAVSFSAAGNVVYVGGHFDKRFTSVSGSVVRHQLASVNPANGATVGRFHPALTRQFPGVWALISGPNNLLVGGGFRGVTGRVQPRYAQFPGA